jgi:MoaA/NifB/PqqE/SkfB family radical SAM enzyme
MTTFSTLEPAVDPNNRITFLLDWELTLKCNLDCSYCLPGTYGGHDNTTKHPSLEDCVKTIDFMYKYADLYMENKIKGIKYVILNVYGGESLHHPHIVKILEQVREKYKQQYQSKWHLTITTTTNAIVSEKKLKNIIPLIDEFTCSYHSETTHKQKQQFKENVLLIKNSGKRIKCIVLMHSDQTLFDDSSNMISWCEQHGIKYLPRQLDHIAEKKIFNYTDNQVIWFDRLYKEKSNTKSHSVEFVPVDNLFDLSDSGRACCGGRQLCKDSNYKQKEFFVGNKFTDWYCSVNEFFLFVKQVNGEIYTNKDCEMNYDGNIAPIGTLDQSDKLLNFIQENIKNNTMPVIQCKKKRCLCGLCAPKSKNLEDFKSIMKKYYKK